MNIIQSAGDRMNTHRIEFSEMPAMPAAKEIAQVYEKVYANLFRSTFMPEKTKVPFKHVRELELKKDAPPTADDLFKLIDLPYSVTRRATVSVIPQWGDGLRYPEHYVLRVEWLGGDGTK